MVEDAELLRRYAAEHSEAAFAELVTRHVDFVYASALRRLNGDAHAAADVTQRVFTTLAQKAGRIAVGVVLPGWLFSTTRNLSAEFVRAASRRRTREKEAHFMQTQNASDSTAADWERLRPLLDGALDELGTSDREVVLLRFFAGRSFGEIGRALQMKEDAARMRVERALKKLHALLAKRGITSTTAALVAALANEVTVAAPATMAGGVTRIALASAGAPAGSTLSLIQIMATTKFLGTAATVLALLAIGFAGRNLHAREQAHTALAAARLRHGELIARATELERRVRAADETVAGLQQKVAAAEAKAVLETEAANSASPWDRVAAAKAFEQRHPEITAVLAEWKDVWLTGMWGEFWKSRGLTPAQIEEFKSLFRWAQARKITADGKFGQFYSAGGNVSEAEFRRRMKALLGEEGMREYGKIMFTTYSVNNYVYELARGLSFAETPLTPAQANRLTETIFEQSQPRRTYHSVDWDAVDNVASQVLSADQRRVWKNVSAVGRAQLELNAARAMAQKAAPATRPSK